MSINLVIVESPAKAKTIKKYLGKDFEVLASYGHVRDLVAKEGAVDPTRDFAMKYEVIKEKNKDRHVDAIEKAARKAKSLYLATDPDREGEAISWHLYEILKERGVLEGKAVHRAKFFEITKNEIQNAIANPEQLSHTLVDAQQARRALDYLVGFNLSPLLWKKIMPGLSAGRVQSVALRLICDREAEIKAFVSQEYWTVEVEAAKGAQNFRARLVEFDGEKVEADVSNSRFSITTEARAKEIERRLNELSGGTLAVTGVEKKPRSRSPQAPFRTSTLQQAAANRLGFTARRTMQTAQRLYEGVDFGEGPIGLITYMRTDSTSLAAEAIGHIREFIGSTFGAHNVPPTPRTYANKQANAQEAHEAIRPTNVTITPEQLRGRIDEDQWRLYQLIWQRSVASQMPNALYEQTTATLVPGAWAQKSGLAAKLADAARAGADGARGGDGPSLAAGAPAVLRASGSVLKEPGYLAVYNVDANDDEDAAPGEDGARLPALNAGDRPDLKDVLPEQHFTQPPPRYTEASLVKALEERGIGRPSTYASIIETLRFRKYVDADKRNFVPTDTARIVIDFLVKFFPSYVDYDFTARLEEELDEISRGDREWIPVMHEFWKPFIKLVKHVETSVTREEVAQARQLGIDPKSGRPVSVRVGQYGPFAQLGTKDDVEKPKFAGLRPFQKMDSITLEEALQLFELPRALGQLPTGEKVSVGVGRFGPYVKYGDKFVSLKIDDPYTIDFPRALEVIEEKKIADAERTIRDFGVDNVQVLKGRFGPYITDGKRNAKIPKDREPTSLSLEECQALLAVAPLRGANRFGRKKTAPVAAPAANDAGTGTNAAAKTAKKGPGSAANKGSATATGATGKKSAPADGAAKAPAVKPAGKAAAKPAAARKTVAAKAVAKPTAKPAAKPAAKKKSSR
jgi:DNA topoisomerase-1